MSDETKYVREVCETATPGPWWAEAERDGGRSIVSDHRHATKPVVTDDFTAEDAHAIALLGSTWPQMLDVIEAAADTVTTAGWAYCPECGEDTDGAHTEDCHIGNTLGALDAYRIVVRAHQERNAFHE